MVFILSAPTGSGKSSNHINALFENCDNAVLCTKPTRALTLEPMTDLPKHYPKLIPGTTLGYIMGDNQSI